MSQAHRDHGLDCTKGIAIFAVVLFHVTRGFTLAGLLPDTMALRFADTFAYGFHVQTFFLIAGYLAFPKADDARYQLRRQTSFYYTYLLWSLISWTLSAAFSHTVNKPMGWNELAWVPIVPIQHFWFILALMAGTATLGLLRTASWLLAAIGLCLGLGYGLSAAGADQILGALAIYLQSLPYILIGGWLRQSGARPVVTLAIALVSLIAFSAAVWWATLAGTTLTTLAGLPITLAGCYAAYAAGTFATRSHWLSSALAMLGQHSYVIYLLHVITGAGARIALGKLAPGLDVAIAVLVSLAAAIVLPILFERIVRKLGVATLLGLEPLSFRISARKEAPVA